MQRCLAQYQYYRSAETRLTVAPNQTSERTARCLCDLGVPVQPDQAGSHIGRRLMARSQQLRSLELRSKATSSGELELWLDDFNVPDPEAGQVVVRIEAAPINPSDMMLMFGPADLSTIHVVNDSVRPAIAASIPLRRLPAIAGRLDQAIPVGNEGAGVVVEAGEGAEKLIGRAVAFRSELGTYAQYRTIAVSDCMLLRKNSAQSKELRL
jgi:hypothetical protein